MEKSHGASEKTRRTAMFPRLSLALVLTIRLIAGSDAERANEYQVKAACLYNFTKFIVWPAEAFRDSDKTFTICILGRDPFGTALDDMVSGRAIDGRPYEVRRLSDAPQTTGCRVVYVGASDRKQLHVAEKQIGVLTVAEGGGPTSARSIISFTMDAGKVRFEINNAAAEDGKLRVSSRLLSLATVVKR
jgi:YfiR/HmsC-like